jgi:hypothetical protein
MRHTLEQTLVRNILEHPGDYPWRIQNIGVLALRLDDRREHRLHVWDPEGAVGDPPVHDHPFDFTSTVVVGELINTRYVEDPSGVEYCRDRCSPDDEDARRTDTVRLVGTSTPLGPGSRYHQLAHELHDSRQAPGTVTLLRMQRALHERSELTLCRRPGAPWVSGQARPATENEVTRITALALAQFDTLCPRDEADQAFTSSRS